MVSVCIDGHVYAVPTATSTSILYTGVVPLTPDFQFCRCLVCSSRVLSFHRVHALVPQRDAIDSEAPPVLRKGVTRVRALHKSGGVATGSGAERPGDVVRINRWLGKADSELDGETIPP